MEQQNQLFSKKIIVVAPNKWIIPWESVTEIQQTIKELLTVEGDLIYTPDGIRRSPFKVEMFQKFGFKAGLVRYLNEKLSSYQIKLDLPNFEDANKEEIFEKFSLREYQREACESILKEKFGIIKLPTAAGKSRIVLALAMIMPKPVLIVVPSRDLLMQFFKIFKEYKIKCGVYGSNYKIWDDEIMLTTGKSIIGTSKLLKEFVCKSCKTLIVDEVHHSTGKHYAIFGKSSALYRVGFSATPYIKDWSEAKTLKLFANFGGIVYDGTGKEEIEKVRMKPKVYTYKYKAKKLSSEFFAAVARRDFKAQREYGITFNEDRNRLILKIADSFRKMGMRIYILTIWTRHVEEFKRLASEMNIPVYFLTGEVADNIRSEIYDKMRNENIIICGTVGGEGVDITTMNVILFADIGKAEIKVIQGLGRPARKDKNKNVAMAIDIQDAIFPKWAKQRNKIYAKEGYEVGSLVNYFKELKKIKEDKNV
jgi:superfamily II DNA or RNA helicase